MVSYYSPRLVSAFPTLVLLPELSRVELITENPGVGLTLLTLACIWSESHKLKVASKIFVRKISRGGDETLLQKGTSKSGISVGQKGIEDWLELKNLPL